MTFPLRDDRLASEWLEAAEDDTAVVQELCANHGRSGVVLRWRLQKPGTVARLILRPLLSCRDYHALHHENNAFNFEPEVAGASLIWRPYRIMPAISILANGSYRHEPVWYRNFLYQTERERGLDHVEDLASPGSFDFDLGAADAVVVLQAGEIATSAVADPGRRAGRLFEREAIRRAVFTSPLERAASAHIVPRGRAKTVIAGYPWFTDKIWDALVVLGFAIVLESFSLYGCLREIRNIRGRRPFREWLKHTRNSELIVVLGEDIAALVGLARQAASAICAGVADFVREKSSSARTALRLRSKLSAYVETEASGGPM